MKVLVYYLVAIYTGVLLWSIYGYLADILADQCFLTMHWQHLQSYLVYSVLYKAWLFGLILPCYFLMFNKYQGTKYIIYKLSFIVLVSIVLSAIYLKHDLCYIKQPGGARLFVIYLATGLSLLCLHIKYWHIRAKPG